MQQHTYHDREPRIPPRCLEMLLKFATLAARRLLALHVALPPLRGKAICGVCRHKRSACISLAKSTPPTRANLSSNFHRSRLSFFVPAIRDTQSAEMSILSNFLWSTFTLQWMARTIAYASNSWAPAVRCSFHRVPWHRRALNSLSCEPARHRPPLWYPRTPRSAKGCTTRHEGACNKCSAKAHRAEGVQHH